jgi:hypothetical protein
MSERAAKILAELGLNEREGIFEDYYKPGEFWYDFMHPQEEQSYNSLIRYFPRGRLVRPGNWVLYYEAPFIEQILKGENYKIAFNRERLAAIALAIRDFEDHLYLKTTLRDFGKVFIRRVRYHFQVGILGMTEKKHRHALFIEEPLMQRVWDDEMQEWEEIEKCVAPPIIKADPWEIVFAQEHPAELFILISDTKLIGYPDNELVQLLNQGGKHWHTPEEQKIFPLVIAMFKKRIRDKNNYADSIFNIVGNLEIELQAVKDTKKISVVSLVELLGSIDAVWMDSIVQHRLDGLDKEAMWELNNRFTDYWAHRRDGYILGNDGRWVKRLINSY